MNARKRQTEEPQGDRQSMKGALAKSVIFHVGIVLATLVSVPFITKEPLIITPVSVELVDISDVTRTNRVAPPRKEPEKPKEIEAPKPPEPKPEPPKQVAEKPPEPKPPEPKKEEPKKEPEKKPEPPKEALAPPKPEKKEPEKKPEPPKPKPPEPKKEELKKEERQEEDFASLLKNLTPAESKPQPTPDAPEKPVEDAEPAAGQMAELSDRLSVSELDAFRRQIEPCWNVPAGAEYAENLAVEVRVVMRRDMTVQDAGVLDKARYNRDSTFRAAADSALRALRNPRCSPLKLPPDKYNEWKTIVINFDPREML